MAKILYKMNGKLLKTADNKILGYEKASYKEALADNTWEDIQKGLREGNPMNWQVGDTKPLTLTNGDTYNVMLVDLQEGRYEDTSNVKCKATFLFVELLKGITRAMNSSTKSYDGTSSYTAGGWLNSDMRAYIQTSVLPLIPEELSNYMLLNKVGSAKYGDSGQSDTSNGGVIIYSNGDKLFLPTASEMFGNGSGQSYFRDYTTMVNAYPQFDYYVTHNTNADRIKYQLGSTSASWWWNRSPSYDDANNFCNVNSAGCASYHGAYNAGSLGLCFTL